MAVFAINPLFCNQLLMPDTTAFTASTTGLIVSVIAFQVSENHLIAPSHADVIQACGATRSEAHQLVDYVFNRPVGDKPQEVGGVMVTLAALCLAHQMDMHKAGEIELARIWTKVEQIRAKQATKPKHSPLPGPCEERRG